MIALVNQKSHVKSNQSIYQIMVVLKKLLNNFKRVLLRFITL